MPKYEHQEWPSWRYGPGGQADIFQHAEQVPEGWVDHPNQLPAKDRPKDWSNPRGGQPSFPSEDAGTVAADHTLGGDENINRGTPETNETDGGGTTGGELGQTVDNTNIFSLPPVEEATKPWIISQLNTRKIVHNPNWRKEKLYDLLRDAVGVAE